MPDYNFLIESRLSPEQFQVVRYLSRLAASQKLNLYLVGGAVRDLTHGMQPIRDLDFALEGNARKIIRQLEAGDSPKHRPREAREPDSDVATVKVEHVRYDPRRNSAEMIFANGVRAELGMTRSETYTKPGHHPEIAPATIFEDLKRRDFSVNAMAISLHPNSRGLLLDPTNGVGDVERQELRALHSRSFVDDPSRIYRFLRFTQRLGQKPEERTQRWLDNALSNGERPSLDAEAQGRELAAILHEENPSKVLKLLTEHKLVAGLDRKLASLKIPYEGLEKIRTTLRSLPGADPFLLNVYCLTAKMPPEHRTRLAKMILGGGAQLKTVLSLERDARSLAQVLSSSKANQPSAAYQLLAAQPSPLLHFLLIYHSQPKVQSHLKHFLFKVPSIKAALPSAELRTMGMEPGPKFDKVLESVLLQQLDGKLKTPQQITKALRDLSGIREPAPSVPPRKKRLSAPARGAKPTTPAKAGASTTKSPAAATKPSATAGHRTASAKTRTR